MNTSAPFFEQVSQARGAAKVQLVPKLWNPGAAASWSLLFSPVFGAFLQMKNWEELGEHAQARKSKAWAIGSAVFFMALVLLTVVAPDPKLADGLSRLFALALLLTWYFTNGKHQQTYVASRFGKSYLKRGWSKPLSLAVTAFLASIFVLAGIGFLLGFASAST